MDGGDTGAGHLELRRGRQEPDAPGQPVHGCVQGAQSARGCGCRGGLRDPHGGLGGRRGARGLHRVGDRRQPTRGRGRERAGRATPHRAEARARSRRAGRRARCLRARLSGLAAPGGPARRLDLHPRTGTLAPEPGGPDVAGREGRFGDPAARCCVRVGVPAGGCWGQDSWWSTPRSGCYALGDAGMWPAIPPLARVPGFTRIGPDVPTGSAWPAEFACPREGGSTLPPPDRCPGSGIPAIPRAAGAARSGVFRVDPAWRCTCV